MLATPNKDLNTSITQSITPVRFLDSPKIKQGASSNYNTCKSRLDVILKTLRDNYAKWQLAQKRGLALCTSIEAIKTRCLEASKRDDDEFTLYPKELNPYCDKISIIVSIFEDITMNVKESLRQLKALNKMTNMSAEVFFRTWKLQQFIDFTEQLLERYEREVHVKKQIICQLPHCLNRADLVRWSTAWEYPQHVNSYIDLNFKFLTEELKIDKT